MEEKKSTFEPDFCAVKLDADPWIVQPFEIYEEIRIEEIKKNIRNKKGVFNIKSRPKFLFNFYATKQTYYT